MKDTLYLVIKESEDKEVCDIDLLTEILDDKAIPFENVADILSWHEDEEDLSECKILKVKVESYYKVVNNPKLTEVQLSKTNSKKSKN